MWDACQTRPPGDGSGFGPIGDHRRRHTLAPSRVDDASHSPRGMATGRSRSSSRDRATEITSKIAARPQQYRSRQRSVQRSISRFRQAAMLLAPTAMHGRKICFAGRHPSRHRLWAEGWRQICADPVGFSPPSSIAVGAAARAPLAINNSIISPRPKKGTWQPGPDVTARRHPASRGRPDVHATGSCPLQSRPPSR